MVLHLTVFWHSECPSSPPPRVEEKGNQHWQYIFLIHMHSKEPTHGLRNTHPQPTLFHIHTQFLFSSLPLSPFLSSGSRLLILSSLSPSPSLAPPPPLGPPLPLPPAFPTLGSAQRY
jgi:hypothetical protein